MLCLLAQAPVVPSDPALPYVDILTKMLTAQFASIGFAFAAYSFLVKSDRLRERSGYLLLFIILLAVGGGVSLAGVGLWLTHLVAAGMPFDAVWLGYCAALSIAFFALGWCGIVRHFVFLSISLRFLRHRYFLRIAAPYFRMLLRIRHIPEIPNRVELDFVKREFGDAAVQHHADTEGWSVLIVCEAAELHGVRERLAKLVFSACQPRADERTTSTQWIIGGRPAYQAAIDLLDEICPNPTDGSPNLKIGKMRWPHFFDVFGGCYDFGDGCFQRGEQAVAALIEQVAEKQGVSSGDVRQFASAFRARRFRPRTVIELHTLLHESGMRLEREVPRNASQAYVIYEQLSRLGDVSGHDQLIAFCRHLIAYEREQRMITIVVETSAAPTSVLRAIAQDVNVTLRIDKHGKFVLADLSNETLRPRAIEEEAPVSQALMGPVRPASAQDSGGVVAG